MDMVFNAPRLNTRGVYVKRIDINVLDKQIRKKLRVINKWFTSSFDFTSLHLKEESNWYIYIYFVHFAEMLSLIAHYH